MSNVVIHPASMTRYGGYDMDRCMQLRGFRLVHKPGARFAFAVPLPTAMAGEPLAPLSEDRIHQIINTALLQLGGAN